MIKNKRTIFNILLILVVICGLGPITALAMTISSQPLSMSLTMNVGILDANFGINQTEGSVPLDVQFTDRTTGGPTSWYWDFGDGTTSTLQNPEHTYNTAGIYTPILTASNEVGTSTKISTVTITAESSLDAHFRINQTEGSVPLDVQFTDRTTGGPTSWYWDFGDGTTSTLQNPEHIYNEAGIYTPILTASNEVGTSTKISTVPIAVIITAESSLDAHFRINPTDGLAPLTVQFTDRTTGGPTSWYWDFGDGTTSTLPNPEHTYNTAGIYTPILTASNEVGTSTKISTVTITAESSLDAHFRINQTEGSVPLDVQFTDRTTGGPTSWYWDFGDGTNSTQQNPEHIYNTAGIYTPILTASNALGTSTKISTVTITTESTLDAHFRINPTDGLAPLTVQFTDRTTGGPTSWYWDFGDGTTSTLQDPEHTYYREGIYWATLTASDEVGTSTKISTVPITAT